VKPGRACANTASVTELPLTLTRSDAGRLSGAPERPHSPAQLQPRAEV